MMHWSNFGGMGYGGYGLGWIFMVLIWAVLILGFTYLLKRVWSGSIENSEKGLPEEILKKRYAADEITKDEFTEKLAVIKRH